MEKTSSDETKNLIFVILQYLGKFKFLTPFFKELITKVFFI